MVTMSKEETLEKAKEEANKTGDAWIVYPEKEDLEWDIPALEVPWDYMRLDEWVDKRHSDPDSKIVYPNKELH